MKRVDPTPAALALRKALEAVIGKEGAQMDAAEILAVFSHLVGQLIALQDQRTMTPRMALELVQSNLELGNREVVDGLLSSTGGHA